MVIYRFRCILCGVTKDYEYGRRTSSNRYHTAVMLGALMVFKGMKVDLARSTYSATTFRRKTLCNLHFAEAAKFMSTEIAAAGEFHGDLAEEDCFANVPRTLVEKIYTAVKQLDETLSVMAANIVHFLNDSVVRYGSVTTQEKKDSSAKALSPSLPTLEETDPQLLDEVFSVQGRSLLQLFRFCPACGTVLDKESGGSVRLTAKDKIPAVDVVCKKCWSLKAAPRRWEGVPGVDDENTAHSAEGRRVLECSESLTALEEVDVVASSSEEILGTDEPSSHADDGRELAAAPAPKSLNELTHYDCEQFKNHVLMRFRCILCGHTRDLEFGRRCSSNRQLSAVLIAALVLFKSMDLVAARFVYIACMNKRKLLCHVHFAEAAKFLAVGVSEAGGRLPRAADNLHELRANDFDIPPRVLDSLNSSARLIDENLELKSFNVADFLSSSLLRYGPGSEFDVESPVKWPTGVAVASSSRGKASAKRTTDVRLQDKLLQVEGRKLLELFAFCLVCGTPIEKSNGSSFCLTAQGRTPIVKILCGMCWIFKRPQQNWIGCSSADQEDSLSKHHETTTVSKQDTEHAECVTSRSDYEVSPGKDTGTFTDTPAGGGSCEREYEGDSKTHILAANANDRPKSKVLLSYRCVLCESTFQLDRGRMSFSSPSMLAVMLSALMVFKSMSVEQAKLAYAACKDKRKMMCKAHYAEAAKLIAAELAVAVGCFPRWVTDMGSMFTKDADIPGHLLDCLNASAKLLDSSTTLAAADVGRFLNGYLVRYESGSEIDKQTSSTWPPDLPMASLSQYDLSSSEAPPTLSKTVPALLDEIFLVECKKLFALFRCCPVCGIAIDAKAGGYARLYLDEGTPTPTVDVACGMCWITKSTQRRWKGVSDEAAKAVAASSGNGATNSVRPKRECSSDSESERPTRAERISSRTSPFCDETSSSHVTSGPYGTPGFTDDAGIKIQSVQNKRRSLVRFRCVLCGCIVDIVKGRMSSSSKQLNGVMLAALMVFKSLDVERARLTYNLCYSKRKMVCRKHYREAATCIADEVTKAVGGLPSQGNYTRFLSQGFEIPHHLLESLNTYARQLEESLLITPANIGHFVDGSFSPLNQSEGTESFDQNIFGKRRRVMHEKKLDEENVTAPITESDVKVRLSVSSAEDVSTNHKELFLGGVVKTEEP